MQEAKNNPLAGRRGLYLITPDGWPPSALQTTLKPLLGPGVALLQYRDKRATSSERLSTAQMLAALCRQYDTPLIVNDDVDLARAVGAAGVHLGRADNDPGRARERLGGGAVIGCSCYNDLRLARRMRAAGADYLSFGSVFASPTKPEALRCPLDHLTRARSLGLPVVAIGGITVDNAAAALRAGADLLAVISDIFTAADPPARLRRYQRIFADTTIT